MGALTTGRLPPNFLPNFYNTREPVFPPNFYNTSREAITRSYGLKAGQYSNQTNDLFLYWYSKNSWGISKFSIMWNSWIHFYIWTSRNFSKKRRNWDFMNAKNHLSFLDCWNFKILVKKYVMIWKYQVINNRIMSINS